MPFYGVESDSTEEALELFTSRDEAEMIVGRGIETNPTRRGSYGSRRSSFGRGRRTSRAAALSRRNEELGYDRDAWLGVLTEKPAMGSAQVVAINGEPTTPSPS